MKVDVLNLDYERISSVELDSSLFDIEARSDILSRVVRWQLAKRRAGTHQTKTISMVSGTGKKSVKQKGSGGARHGSKRGTQFRGGGIVFGPTPRSYEYSLQKKVRKLGLRMAIADKMKSGELVIIEDLNIELLKAKTFLSCSCKNGINSALFVDNVMCDGLTNAVCNRKGYNVIPQIGLNVYDILKHDRLIVAKNAIDAIEARLR